MKFCRNAAFLAVAGMICGAVGCDNQAKADGYVAKSAEQRPDSALLMLMRSISDENPQQFASICVYPIQRNYPLRNIEDSATMVDYFPILIDDSLKNVAKTSHADDWIFYGWRGWALGDSTILWFDDGLQFVDYESKAETGLRKMLAKEEIRSLLPELQEGWIPVETLVEIDGDKIFRIDTDEKDSYRLMEYDSDADMRGMPALILIGSLDMEGSADYRVFVFTDSVGTKAEYSPDAEPPVTIDISKPGKPYKSHKVKRGYWRDKLR